jgi:hypothetical protein
MNNTKTTLFPVSSDYVHNTTLSGTELKSQLSMLGRYREFVPEYAQLTAPLEAIMDGRWGPDTFTIQLQERLIEIRRCIAQETMLTMPDWNRPFH